MPIIFDEYKHAEKMLYNGTMTNNTKFELQLLANYYRALGYIDSEIEVALHDFSKRYLKNYNKVKFYKLIDKKVELSRKLKLKSATPINITKKEMKTILGEENYKCQKLMFVYLVLAKYYMSNNKTDKYYVGCKDNDIFNLCNMYVKKQDKLDLMHYLTKNKYITPTLSMSSIVNYVDESGDIAITLIPDTDMVFYFEQYLGGIFIHCDRCNKLVKKTSNRMRYCKECANILNKEQTSLNRKNKSLI